MTIIGDPVINIYNNRDRTASSFLLHHLTRLKQTNTRIFDCFSEPKRSASVVSKLFPHGPKTSRYTHSSLQGRKGDWCLSPVLIVFQNEKYKMFLFLSTICIQAGKTLDTPHWFWSSLILTRRFAIGQWIMVETKLG